ncbi:TRAP transporter substrate-binding protein DctP [Oceanobacillus saliphilus]|uniref:TRAP transporter substrate-binding protein DctP n=1 Tax=Oceanobacillus saliphilus TaxID=2925834 RepID=UPI00201E0CC8|nr:TRAP transporter substrate-binding protein DctP [Oceanobacillus saliphilus]
MRLKVYSILFIFLLILAACGTTEAEDTITTTSGKGSKGSLHLKASSGVPTEHFWDRGFFAPLLKEVEEDSGEELSFDKFVAGELVELGNEFDALNSGSIDIALTLMGPYDPQRFPYTEVVMLPTLGSDAEMVTEALENLMKSDHVIANGKTFYEIEFEDKGLVAFPNPATEPYVISTTKNKFEKKDDFTQTIRLRTASRVHEILSEKLGVTGQSMPISESYDALSRNALDGIIYNAPDWIAFGFDELIKHTIVDANVGHFAGYTAMKQETWDSFSTELQQLFEEKAYEITHHGASLTKGETEENYASNKEKGGEIISFQDLDPDLKQHLEAAIVDTWFDWIEILEADGFAGNEIALLWRDLLMDAGGTLPQEILDLE